jgi:hypothetical protein
MELVPSYQPGTNYVLIKEMLFKSYGVTSEKTTGAFMVA